MNKSTKISFSDTKPKIVTLVGMMGSGKTKFGKFLSKKLKFDFYDIDEVIEAKLQTPISEIFKNFGEKYFRNSEKKVINSMIKDICYNKKNSILSLGGGSFDDHSTRKLLLSQSLVIWLHCSIEILVNRVGDGRKRPMLKENIEGNLKKLLIKRKKFYEKAHIKFDTTKISYNDFLEKIKKQI